MPRTPYRDYPLYADDAAPDLTATGEYNQAVEAIDSDMHGEIETRISEDARIEGLVTTETSERKAADATLETKIDKEVADRGSADAALSGRIDNAEAEISANSADLTGIKSLTYGTGQQVFLENDNGSYSSPALEEIQHEIEQRVIVAAYDTSTGAVTPNVNTLYSYLRNGLTVLIWDKRNYSLFWPVDSHPQDNSAMVWAGVTPKITKSYAEIRALTTDGATNSAKMSLSQIDNYWSSIISKPFSTVGSGLKVVSNALTVDTAALPSGESEIFTVTVTGSETPTLSATFAEMLAAYNASKLVFLRAGSLVMPLSSTITGDTGEISSLMFSLLIGGTTGESVASYFTITVSSANKIDIKEGVIPDESAQALTKSDLANITWGALEAAIVVPT